MDINSLTLADVAKIEELSGQPIGSLADEKAPKGKSLAAMAYVFKRKQLAEQDLPVAAWKFTDALALTIEEAYEILGLTDEPSTDDVLEGDDSVPLDSKVG